MRPLIQLSHTPIFISVTSGIFSSLLFFSNYFPKKIANILPKQEVMLSIKCIAIKRSDVDKLPYASVNNLCNLFLYVFYRKIIQIEGMYVYSIMYMIWYILIFWIVLKLMVHIKNVNCPFDYLYYLSRYMLDRLSFL